ncbi:TonB-dependent receptor plug domain-containing protein, partial [Mucilaginibacter sp.]|uniref:TonB-dependent receptor plug domain-containing protein n=1 Tax=Mucilaginibacter sp. TaxID=1882438 RepID=UPI002ED2E7F5
MKYSKITTVLCALFTLIAGVARGQEAVQINIAAVVHGQNGEPVQGARIKNDRNIETATNDKGGFNLMAPSKSLLTISANGYIPVTRVASDTLKVIDLVKEQKYVQVAFRKVQEKDLLGGVSTVDYKSIFEKNYTTYGFEGIEAFAAGYHGNIRGNNSYLVLIDGVPREVDNIMPSEIDQITFLKSASAVALYGSRGAKGVVLITTKRGSGDGQKINVRVNAGVNVPKSYPEYLGSAEYMTLYNEARRNDGLDPLYTTETIYNHASGKNPYRYPNVDYYSREYLKSSFARYDGTAEISGGNDRARYYTNFGYWSAGSLLNFGAAKNNNSSDRVNMRGNIDMNLTSVLKARVDVSAVFYSGRGVNTDYWGSAANLRPYRFTPLIPLSLIEQSDEPSQLIAGASSNIIDGKYLLGGTQLDQTNPFAAIYAGGSNNFVSRQFQFTTGVDADLKGILKGLTFSTTLGVDYRNSYNQGYSNGYTVYQPNWTRYNGTDVIGSLTPFGRDTKSGIQNVSDSWYRQTISFSGQFNYKTSIAGQHNLSAVLMGAAFRQSQSAIYQNVTNSNSGLQLGYNFRQKYYLDFTGAMVYSPKFSNDKAYGFSPTAAIGWRISEEPFLKKIAFINNLKLTASGGIIYTDLDVPDYFLYQSIYTQQGSYYGWNDGTLAQTTDSRRGSNNALTFAKRKELSVGLEGALFKNMISFSANVFRSDLVDNAIQSTTLFPSYFSVFNSSFIPFVNYDGDRRTGFDLSLNLHQRSGSVDWSLGATATYYNTKATKRAEFFADSYQKREGKPLDAIWGLRNDGFYMDAAEAAAANTGNGLPQP